MRMPSPATSDTRVRGVRITWWWTAGTMWFCVTLMMFGPVGYLFITPDVGLVRRILLLILAAVTVWSCHKLINAAHVGLARESLRQDEIVVALAAPAGYVVIGSINPALTFGVLLPAWTCVMFVALQFTRLKRWLWFVASAAALCSIRFVVVMVTGGSVTDFGTIETRQIAMTVAVFAVFIPVMTWFQVWFWEIMLQVRDAGIAQAELATVRERLRFAADLHDIQGHHLQVIALKAELAERLLERDLDAARQSIAEVQQTARTAIAETRGLVQGYRQVSLHEEALNAAAVLEATGAEVTVRIPDGLEHPLLATALREATTNILRHSSPTRVEIVGSTRPPSLRIRNDGARRSFEDDTGTGLSSLNERLAEAGGTLEAEQHDGWFTIRAELEAEGD